VKRGPTINNIAPRQVLHNVAQKLRRIRSELSIMMQQVDEALARIEAEEKAT
jgi:hypothetical protein